MMMYHQTKFSCKMISSSKNSWNDRILIIWVLTVTLALKIAKHSFRTRHSDSWWRIIMLLWAPTGKIVEKILSGQIFNKVFNVRCDHFTRHFGLWRCTVTLLAVDQQFRKHNRNSRLSVIWTVAMNLTLTTEPKLSHNTRSGHTITFWTFVVALTLTSAASSLTGHFGIWWSTTKLSFGCKRIISSEDKN